MNRKNTFIGIAIVACAGLGLFALVKIHSNTSSGDDDDENASDNTPALVSVQVGALKRMTLHHYVTGYGAIEAEPATAHEPAAGAALAAPTAGVVAKVNVIAGQHVEKGGVLVELNSAAATFDYAQAEVGRQKKLFAQQNTSLKNEEDAEARLSSLQIVAPVSGTVTALNVKPGQAVDTTTIVADVIDLDRLAVSAKIPAAQATELQAGQEVRILTTPPAATTLSFVSPAVDPNDGTVAVWASIPPDSKLLPGQFVQFEIAAVIHTNCLAAPAESVVTDDHGNSSISLVHDNQSAQTPVQTGLREDGWVEVSAPGLKEGDPVVTVGAYGLPDKTDLKIVSPSDNTSTTNSPQAMNPQ